MKGGKILAAIKKSLIFEYEGRSYIEAVEFRKAVCDQTWKMAQIALVLNLVGSLLIWLLTENAAAAVIPVISAAALFLVINFLNNLTRRGEKKDMA